MRSTMKYDLKTEQSIRTEEQISEEQWIYGKRHTLRSEEHEVDFETTNECFGPVIFVREKSKNLKRKNNIYSANFLSFKECAVPQQLKYF